MSFGYPAFYANGINSNTQLRNSVDMIYQRGGTYEVVLTGDTFQSSMELDVDMFANDNKVGRMSLVPYDVTQSGATYVYRFNIRPYSYMQNYIKSEHYQYYWKNNWSSTNNTININNPYPNSIRANYKYGWKYVLPSGQITGETTNLIPSNDFNHYSNIPNCIISTGFTPSDFTNTGKYFDYFGGTYQFDDKYILQNFDQEIGTVIGTGFTVNTIDTFRRLSPSSQFYLDYPTVPEMSESARFLTEAPRIQYIQSDENYILSYINGQTGDRFVTEADYAVFEFYNESNSLINQFNIQLNVSGTTYESPTGYTDNSKIFHLPCGPLDITNIYSDSINWDSIAYYRVQLFYSYPTNNNARVTDGPIGPVSEAFYFYLYKNCLPENTRICWLNSRGGWDYYTFQSFRQFTNKITRQTYDNRYFSTNLSSPDRNVARTTKTFAQDIDQELVLESNYLSLSMSGWLEEMFYSPQVYEVKPDFISPIDRQDKIYKDLTPLLVVSTDVETLTKKHTKLNKYRITFKTANTQFANKGF